MYTFATTSEMIEFFRNTPKSTNFAHLLLEDYNTEPTDSDARNEYLWKYCVQEEHKGTAPNDIVRQARIATEKFFSNYPWLLHPVESTTAPTAPTATKTAKANSRRGETTNKRLDAMQYIKAAGLLTMERKEAVKIIMARYHVPRNYANDWLKKAA